MRILDKSELMDSQENNYVVTMQLYSCSYVVTIFMNPFNAVHAFTEPLTWRDYVNNADLLQ